MAREETFKISDLIEDFIDLNIIENKLISGEYLSAYHFAKDMRKMLNDYFLYYSKDPTTFSQVYEFGRVFESLFKGYQNLVFSESIIQDLNKKIEKLTQSIKEFQNKIPSIKSLKDKKMTSIEKKQLCQSLKKLEPKYLHGVVKIINRCMNVQGDELEFDIEKLPQKVCRELERYIKQCLQIKPQKKKGLAEVVRNENFIEDNSRNDPELHSDSSESSSSSSESEDEMPGAPMYSELWEKDVQDFTNGISIDFDKL